MLITLQFISTETWLLISYREHQWLSKCFLISRVNHFQKFAVIWSLWDHNYTSLFCSIFENQASYIRVFSLFSVSEELFTFCTTQQMSFISFPWSYSLLIQPLSQGVSEDSHQYLVLLRHFSCAPLLGPPQRWDLLTTPAGYQTLNWYSMS